MNGLLTMVLLYVRRHPFKSLFFVLFRGVGIIAVLGAFAYTGFVEGSKTSQNLTDDFAALSKVQGELVAELIDFNEVLLSPDARTNFDDTVETLATSAEKVIVQLGALRAPTGKIEGARADYRHSLEELVGLTNLARRDPSAVSSLRYHNAIQSVANTGGAFKNSIERFQGGAFPQIIGSIF